MADLNRMSPIATGHFIFELKLIIEFAPQALGDDQTMRVYQARPDDYGRALAAGKPDPPNDPSRSVVGRREGRCRDAIERRPARRSS